MAIVATGGRLEHEITGHEALSPEHRGVVGTGTAGASRRLAMRAPKAL